MDYINKNVPMKRFASPEEISNLCLFLTKKSQNLSLVRSFQSMEDKV